MCTPLIGFFSASSNVVKSVIATPFTSSTICPPIRSYPCALGVGKTALKKMIFLQPFFSNSSGLFANRANRKIGPVCRSRPNPSKYAFDNS